MLKNTLPTLSLISLLSSDYLFFNIVKGLLNPALLKQDNLDLLLRAVRHYYPNHYRLDEIELSLQHPFLKENGIEYNEITQNCTGTDYQFNFLNNLFDYFFNIQGSNIYAKNEYLDEYITLINKIDPYQMISFKLAYLIREQNYVLPDIQRFICNIKPLGYKVEKTKVYADNHCHLKGSSYAVFHLTQLFLTETPQELYEGSSMKKLPQLSCYSYFNNQVYNLGQVIDLCKLALAFVIEKVIKGKNQKMDFTSYQQDLNMILHHKSMLLNYHNTNLIQISSYFTTHNNQIIGDLKNIENKLLYFALKQLEQQKYIQFQLSIYSLFFYLEQSNSQNIYLKKMIKLYILGCNILRNYLLMSQNIGLAHFSEFSNTLLRDSDNNLKHILDTQQQINTTYLNAKFSYSENEFDTVNRLQEIRSLFKKDNFSYTFCLCVNKRREKRIKLTDFSVAKPRYYYLRKQLEKQAKILDNILSDVQYKNMIPRIRHVEDLLQEKPLYYDLSQDIINIDVVGKETHTPADVFAPYFRFLRRSPKKIHHHILPIDCHINQHMGLLICVHSGEDFNHLLTGLRAIDEAVLFYNMKNNDRLGHALALGINPKQWLKQTQAIVVTEEEWLDNLVWLFKILMEMPFIPISINYELEKLKCEIYTLFKTLYSDSKIKNIHITDLIEAWKMREICPLHYLNAQNKSDILEEYGQVVYSYFKFKKESLIDQIYHAYMFNPKIEERGKKVKFISRDSITPHILKLYEMVQDYLITKYAKIGLIIEANPSSNLFISNLNKYRHHPIFRFYPPKEQSLKIGECFNQYELRQGRLKVCVNSDDPAIFSTTLQNEFRLLKQCAIEYYQCSEQEAGQWIEQLQANGIAIFKENHYADNK